ncbi:hypothetical protein YC2023_008239 [Brassica napus]
MLPPPTEPHRKEEAPLTNKDSRSPRRPPLLEPDKDKRNPPEAESCGKDQALQISTRRETIESKLTHS